VAQPQHADRHEQRGAVDDEEQHVFAPEAGAFAITPRPVPVREVGERGGQNGGDGFCTQGLVVQRAFATNEAQHVEQTHIDDERRCSHDAKLRQLVDDVAKAPVQGVHTDQATWGPPDSLAR